MSIEYEKINFQDRPSNMTPLAARILARLDNAMSDVVTQLNKTRSYILPTTGWISTGEPTYPYKLIIPSYEYKDDDVPICQAWGINDIETAAEIDAIKLIKKVIVDHAGITIYATAIPEVSVKLVIKA